MGRWVRQVRPGVSTASTYTQPRGPPDHPPTPHAPWYLSWNPLLPAQPTFLNHGGDRGLCAPPCVFGGVKKGGSLGAPCQVSLPQPLDLVVGTMMTVRSGRVTMGGMVFQAPFSPPHRAPPRVTGLEVSLACLPGYMIWAGRLLAAVCRTGPGEGQGEEIHLATGTPSLNIHPVGTSGGPGPVPDPHYPQRISNWL